jgi:hypothetical protein
VCDYCPIRRPDRLNGRPDLSVPHTDGFGADTGSGIVSV